MIYYDYHLSFSFLDLDVRGKKACYDHCISFQFLINKCDQHFKFVQGLLHNWNWNILESSINKDYSVLWKLSELECGINCFILQLSLKVTFWTFHINYHDEYRICLCN